MLRIFKYSDIHNISFTPDKELNVLYNIERLPNKSYTMVRFLAHPVHYTNTLSRTHFGNMAYASATVYITFVIFAVLNVSFFAIGCAMFDYVGVKFRHFH